MSVKILPKACSIESVRTNVPLIIATPRTIAIAVSPVRSFRLISPRMTNHVKTWPLHSVSVHSSSRERIASTPRTSARQRRCARRHGLTGEVNPRS